MTPKLLTRICIIACLFPISGAAGAADVIALRFRQSPTCNSNIVRLGDVVEIAMGSELLGPNVLAIPLAPAPREGQFQIWTSEDIAQHLELRGVRREILKWSGESSVKIERSATADPTLRPTAMYPSFLQDRSINQAEINVSNALNDYIASQAGDRMKRDIVVHLPPEHVKRLLSRRNIVAVGGGQAPFEGTQSFVLEVADQQQALRIPIQAEVTPPAMVVVAARSLRQNEILNAEMLKYAPIPQQQVNEQADMISDINQIVGQQLRRSIATGVPILRKTIGSPIVITRGDLLEIESVAGPVTVRMPGRALADGAIGEAIPVENTSIRKRLMATIVNQGKVRIIAAAIGTEQGDQRPPVAMRDPGTLLSKGFK